MQKAPADTDANAERRRIRIGVKQFFWSQNTGVAHMCMSEGHSVWEEPRVSSEDLQPWVIERQESVSLDPVYCHLLGNWSVTQKRVSWC